MDAKRLSESKQELKSELGSAYPECREDLSPKFLIRFGDCLPSPDENDFEDYKEYEAAKYTGEQWDYLCRLSEALIDLQSGSEKGKAAWEQHLDWVTENYFPELNRKR